MRSETVTVVRETQKRGYEVRNCNRNERKRPGCEVRYCNSGERKRPGYEVKKGNWMRERDVVTGMASTLLLVPQFEK